MLFDQELVRNNIKYMRKLYGLKQEDIGKILVVTPHAISQYENGKRQLNYEFVQLLANYFRIPIEQFVKEDLSKLAVLNTSVSFKYLCELFRVMFPVVSSEKALKNEDFRKGYEMLQNILKFNNELQENLYEYTYNCIEMFTASYNTGKTVEGVANSIGLTLTLLATLNDKEKQDLGNKLVEERIINIDTVKKHILRKDYIDDLDKAEFKEEVDEYIFDGIYLLKERPEWKELGDYYLAISYIMDVIDNGLKSDTNIMIGEELMCALIKLKNKYACAYHDKKYGFLEVK